MPTPAISNASPTSGSTDPRPATDGARAKRTVLAALWKDQGAATSICFGRKVITMRRKIYAVATRRKGDAFMAAAVELTEGAVPKTAQAKTRECALARALRCGRIYYRSLDVERDILVAEHRDQTIVVGVEGEYLATA